MSGRVIVRPAPPHHCGPPTIVDRGVVEATEPDGTQWACDDCQRIWIVRARRWCATISVLRSWT